MRFSKAPPSGLWRHARGQNAQGVMAGPKPGRDALLRDEPFEPLRSEGNGMMALERKARVRVKEGLHARPATEFVKLAKSFTSEVEILRDGSAANAKSSVKLMLLGVKEAEEIIIRAEGSDAAEALEQLVAFVETPDAGHLPLAAAAERMIEEAMSLDEVAPSQPDRGVPASEGVALGPVFAFFSEPLEAE